MNIGYALRYVMTTAWALEETVLANLAEIVLRHNEGIKLSDDEIARRIKAAVPGGVKTSSNYRIEKGVAIIPISGVISKYSAGIDDISQPDGTSAEQIRGDLRAALADSSVQRIMLDIESPGGSIDGIAELADELAAAGKPICAYANGMMASAAYWIGCQADEVVCSKSAVVGSIGVYTVCFDSSKAAESAGYKVNVVKAGAMKGAGIRGTPITPEQIAESQRTVDAYYNMFVGAVAAGRGIPNDAARAMGDGRVHIGETAKAQNMVDSVGTFEATLARLQASAMANPQPARSGAKSQGVKAMEKTEAEIRAEDQKRITDIKAAFADDAAYALEAICSSKSLMEAQAGYNAVLKSRLADVVAKHAEEIKAKDAEIAKLKAEVPQKRTGNAPIPTDHVGGAPSGSGDGSAVVRFDAVFQQNLKSLGNKTKAMSKTISENKDLHAEMLEEQTEARNKR